MSDYHPSVDPLSNLLNHIKYYVTASRGVK